ncbi:MAG: hypothetical protein WCL32_26045, partial [Planctomycetota bacterium]
PNNTYSSILLPQIPSFLDQISFFITVLNHRSLRPSETGSRANESRDHRSPLKQFPRAGHGILALQIGLFASVREKWDSADRDADLASACGGDSALRL